MLFAQNCCLSNPKVSDTQFLQAAAFTSRLIL